jgi:hypothetical protein
MQEAFWAMAFASELHALEEYVCPGGFLQWLRILFPRSAPNPLGAVVINAVFFLFIFSPLFSPGQATPVFSLSIAGLLIANGALHIAGTFLTRQYSPGAVTSVLCYFPAGIYAFATIPIDWQMDALQVLEAIILGVTWQAIPLSWMMIRR